MHGEFVCDWVNLVVRRRGSHVHQLSLNKGPFLLLLAFQLGTYRAYVLLHLLSVLEGKWLHAVGCVS